MKLAPWFAVLALAVAQTACDKPIPPPDPDGKDLVDGAIVAATEQSGGVRLYKIQHVEDLPLPAGPEYHMIAYDPKGHDFEEAREIWRRKMTKVALDHILVRKVLFMTRDHRVLGVEPLTDDELKPYRRTIN